MQDSGAGDYGVPLEVDISKLEAAIPWLNGLHDYITNNLTNTLSNVSRCIKADDLAFGGFKTAAAAGAKHRQYLKTVAQGYQQIAQMLADTATATQTIINNYNTTEERNAATSADIERILGGSPGTGSSTPVTNTSTTTNGTGNNSKGF